MENVLKKLKDVKSSSVELTTTPFAELMEKLIPTGAYCKPQLAGTN
jgi:hypothetical protein